MEIGTNYCVGIILIVLIFISCNHNRSSPAEGATNVDYYFPKEGNDYIDYIYDLNPDTTILYIDVREEDDFPDLKRFTALSTLHITLLKRGVKDTDIVKLYSCKKLEHLAIVKSGITTMPNGISKLSELKTLSISGGYRLEKLPDDISDLEKLEVLYLWRNNLTEESLPIAEMPSLKELIIGENSLIDIRRLKKKWPSLLIYDYKL